MCGARAPASASKSAPPIVTATLACSKCGANLPDDAAFCLKCGKPVSSPAKDAGSIDVPGVVEPPLRDLPRAPRKRRWIFVTLLLVLLVGVLLWAGTSDSPGAQQFQEFVGWKQDQSIVDTPFSVGPHTFRYYKFSLPEGSSNVAVVGQFTSAADNRKDSTGHTNSVRATNKDDRDKDEDKVSDTGIEAYVLTEPAFTIWQNGYATNSVYRSGRVSQGTMQADIPAGAGIYYLVFSNKFSPKAAKSVNANVLLRYKSWLPEWFRRMKERVFNWIWL